MKRSIAVACLAAAMGLAGPALAAKKSEKKASGDVPVTVTVKPPSGQWEGAPPPAQGWVWAAGYHDWNGDRFVWKPGEWILDKPGMDYRQHQWVPVGEGKWKLVGGDWIEEQHAGTSK